MSVSSASCAASDAGADHAAVVEDRRKNIVSNKLGFNVW
jgi:hypothetical protein